MSKRLEKGEIFNSFAGSQPFMAPEIINRQNIDPFLADIWSLGITFYTIAFGKLPWTANNNEELDMVIKIGIFSFPSYAETAFCNLIRSMTAVNPSKRESLFKLLRSPIFDNIQKYNYTALCSLPSEYSVNVNHRRSLSIIPSSISHGRLSYNRKNNVSYLLHNIKETRFETERLETQDLRFLIFIFLNKYVFHFFYLIKISYYTSHI